MEVLNSLRITQTKATVAQLMGIPVCAESDVPNEIVISAARAVFGMRNVERALLYNPDAVALWLYQKYTNLFKEVIETAQTALPVSSVMPSVTPVCFASMYTGTEPSVHGIQAYVKPVLKAETLFDAAICAGKKPVIISTEGDSISKIFLERDMDYIICSTAQECNEKALEVMKEDNYDIIVVYNGNYDATMHRSGPESQEALEQLIHNSVAFKTLTQAARECWKGKRCMSAYLPDHGCHEIDGKLGSHGLDMPEDMNIIHFYKFWQ